MAMRDSWGDWEGNVMPRKRAGSVFEELAELVAMLPWWLGIGLAIAAYATLGSFAEPAKMAQGIRPAQAVFRAAAAAGQYIVPLVCLFGAAVSAWRRA